MRVALFQTYIIPGGAIYTFCQEMGAVPGSIPQNVLSILKLKQFFPLNLLSEILRDQGLTEKLTRGGGEY